MADHKGLLAMDESTPTCDKRFAAPGIPQTVEARRAWRELLEGMILKPNMVLPGLDCPNQPTVDEVADAPVKCFLQNVPAAVPGIAFLSGGQSGELASARLNATNLGFRTRVPWALAFSYARAIQQSALENLARGRSQCDSGSGGTAASRTVHQSGTARGIHRRNGNPLIMSFNKLSSLDAEMATLLSAVLAIVKVAIISGENWPQFEKQILANLPHNKHLQNLSLLPTCETKFYQYKSTWEQLYAEDFTDQEKEKIIRSLKEVSTDSGFETARVWGEVIEDRGSQITFSALGQEAPIDEKKKWDPDFAKRKTMKASLDKLIPEFSVRLGGTEERR